MDILRRTAPNCEFLLAEKAAELPALAAGMTYTLAVGWTDLISYIRNTPSLRWLHLFTSGVDRLINEAGKIPGYRITNTKGIHGYPISDHVLAPIYAFL